MWMFVWPYPYVASAVVTGCVILVTLATLFYFHRRRQFRFFKRQNIPGPEPSSLFFGNVTDTLAKGGTRTISDWASVYGKTFGYYEGPLPVLVTSDLDLLQQILVKQFQHFSGRKLFPVQPPSADTENSFLVISDGPNWKRVRSIITPTFTTLKMKQIAPLMNQCIDVLMEVLGDRADDEESTEISRCLSGFTLDVITSTAFGLDIDCQRKDSTFKSKVKQVMEHFSAFDLLDVLCVAFSEWRPFWTWWGFCRNLNKPHPFEWVKKRASELINLRIQDQSTRRMDLMQIMLNMSVMGSRDGSPSTSESDSGETETRIRRISQNMGEAVKNAFNSVRKTSISESYRVPAKSETANGERRSSVGERRSSVGERRSSVGERRNSTDCSFEPFTHKEMRGNIAMFLVVGFDTTSALLSYVIYEMALNQDEQQKLYEEIYAELDGKDDLTYDDVHKLSYLDMVIKETLRMHTVVSSDVFSRRCCVDEIEVNGVHFTKDMVIKPDVITVHHDPTIWGPVDVNTFYPERHLPEHYESRHPLCYLPFGFGPRQCVGMRYALLMVKLALVRLFREFQVFKCEDTVPLQTKEDGTILPRAVNVTLTRRHSVDVQ